MIIPCILGDIMPYKDIKNKWDEYYLNICNAVATKCSCLSRQIGAILVKDKAILVTGYNGVPRNHIHCGIDRWYEDPSLKSEGLGVKYTEEEMESTCPRRLLGYKSGKGLHLCPAEHAERNCIATAARMGICVEGSTLYMNTSVPCINCMTLLIGAGVKEFVLTGLSFYDELSKFVYEQSNIKMRLFK